MNEITVTKPTPIGLASLGIYGGDGSDIEAMERKGAEEMAGATHTLPTDGSDMVDELGITWGPVLVDDPLFREATLPEGMRLMRTEHDMWTDVLQDGIKVAAVFYKAAFYDRRAMIRIAVPD